MLRGALVSLVVTCSCGAMIPVEDGEARCPECWRVYIVVTSSTAGDGVAIVVEQELN